MTDTQPLSAEELATLNKVFPAPNGTKFRGMEVQAILGDTLPRALATINQLTAERDEARAYVENTRADHHQLWLKDAEWAVSCGKLVIRAESAEADRDHWKERAEKAEAALFADAMSRDRD